MTNQKIRIDDHNGIGRIYVDGQELEGVAGYEIKRHVDEPTHLSINLIKNPKNLDLNFTANNVRNDLSGDI